MTEQQEKDSLIADIPNMSDDQLLDRAVHYNACLRRGRKLAEEGQEMINASIDLFVICQNELHSRMRQRIERETDREIALKGMVDTTRELGLYE